MHSPPQSDEEMDEEASDDEDESGDPSERGSSVGEDLSAELEQLFAAIVTTKDGDRDISQAFQLLPLKAVRLFLLLVFAFLKW